MSEDQSPSSPTTPRVHIVTDSFAHFPDARILKQYPITIVPNKLTIGSKTYTEGVDLSSDEALKLIANQPHAPTITPPSAADYIRVYSQVIRDYEAVISIHASREVSASWANARRAAQQFAGHGKLAVIDSRSLCVGQGMLAQFAARNVQKIHDFEALVRAVRGTVERIYSMYYVESVDYLLQNKFISPSHGVLGAMLGIKPFLTIENGQLIAVEKVRTRLQAIERMVEFVVEFEEITDAVIVQHKIGTVEQTRILQDRLAVEFPSRTFPYTTYGASLASLIGADASGIVIVEAEADKDDL